MNYKQMHSQPSNAITFQAAEIPLIETKALVGFTMIELMVVVSIIGILAALMLPAIGRGKDLATRTIDIGNLKQMVAATHLYSSDNVDMLPWPNWFAGDAPNRPGWLYTLDETASGTNRFQVQSGVLWPIVKTPKIYWCPRDKPSHPMFKLRDQQSSSYVINGAVCGYKRMRYPSLKLGSFAPDAVVFWETDENDPTYFNDGASRPDEGVSKRHDVGAICSTFSGAVNHTKFATWNNDAAATNKNRLWCYPESLNGR